MGVLNFTKMNGAGNDFILLDSIEMKDLNLSKDLIKKMCDRRRGIGADGILVIEKSEKFDYNLTYYNSDGSLGSLCGNGSRCSIYYYLNKYQTKEREVKFSCNGLKYRGAKHDKGEISFELGNTYEIQLDINIKFEDKLIQGHYVNNGSPHLVIFWDEIESLYDKDYFELDFFQFGKTLRNSELFYPDGVNVNLIKFERGTSHIRTYERGVENETLSCGTGTVASAIVVNKIKEIPPPLSFKTFGGDILSVDFEKKTDIFTKITLTGPVKI